MMKWKLLQTSGGNYVVFRVNGDVMESKTLDDQEYLEWVAEGNTPKEAE